MSIPPDQRLPPGLEHFINKSGEDIPAFGLFFISDTVTKFGETYHKAIKPSTTFYPKLGINLAGPIADNRMGVCATKGDVVVAVDLGTPVNGEGWGVKPGQFTASKGFPGLVCIGAIGTSTDRFLFSLLSPIVTLLGKASGSITARSGTTVGTGSMEIWYNATGTLTDAGFSDITVKNLSASAVTSGGYIQAKLIAGEWWVDFEDCPA